MYISSPVAEECEAVCTSQPYVGAKLAITKGGAMCKCQTESCNARRAVQGSQKLGSPPQQKNQATGTPRGATPPTPPRSTRPGGTRDSPDTGAPGQKHQRKATKEASRGGRPGGLHVAAIRGGKACHHEGQTDV